MARGQEHADRERFEQLTAGLRQAPDALVARLELAYGIFDQLAHEVTQTEHDNDELISVDNYAPAPFGEERQRTVLGIQESEQRIFIARPQGALRKGRFVFGASFLYEPDGFVGKHRETEADKIVIAMTLEELVEQINGEDVHVQVQFLNKH